ncbi:O-antigen ligase family protein [Hirschia litorea]|uniref:O-antigen ligase family protein n=1 Tax=Hirschia litorea TaxID=1199156 RepID=A0ABW2IL86_9PROT
MSAIPWLFAAIVWLPVSFAGALGFVPLVGIIGISALFCKKELQFYPYIGVLIVAIIYAAITSLWSPYTTPLVDINFAKGDFNVRSAVLRIALIAIFGGIALAGVQKIASKPSQWAINTLIVSLVLQGLSLVIIMHNREAVYDLFEPLITDEASAILNLSRNATTFGIGAIILMSLIHNSKQYLGAFRGLVSAVFCFSTAYYLNSLSATAAAVAIVIAWLFMFLPQVCGKYTFRVIGYGTGVFVILSPVIFSVLIAVLGDRKEALELSFLWRVEIWSDVIRQTSDAPIWGRGLDALRTFDAVFQEGVWKGERIIPWHAHNMFLHIWVETGYVGVCLVALAVFLLGRRLPAPSEIGPNAASAACGLWAGCLAICTFSFSLWNDWWWALVVVAVGFVILLRNAWVDE